MNNFRKVQENDILKDWLEFREETLCTLSCAEDKRHLIYFDEIAEKIMRNVPDKNKQFVRKRLKKLDNNFIDIAFLHTAYPTIRSDAIAYIKSHEFEVDMKYIGKKITVKYNPFDFSTAWIYDNGKLIEDIHLVNKVDNSKVKRKNTLY